MPFYQIQLTPVEAYFFGGEKHWKNPNTGNDEMDYFSKSELYPQQTALLGVLRYYLLMKFQLLDPFKRDRVAEANELIGVKSFDFSPNGPTSLAVQNYGKIKKLSPLFFRKDNQLYLIEPLYDDLKLMVANGQYQFKNFSPKKDYERHLINIRDATKVRFFEDTKNGNNKDFVFFPINTIGNKKGKKGITENDSFYKQTRYQLNKGWSFNSEVEIDCEFEDDSVLLPFGAERQIFSLLITKIEVESNLEVPIEPKSLPAIYCISDCFVSEKVWNHVVFAANEAVSFRSLKSSTSTTNYSVFSKKKHLSTKYNLLKRGSILYFESGDKRNQAESHFRNNNAEKIGFNKIQKI